ncbi:hypothetical protein AVEN_95096-1 [Araneus ventricosus]|uniref:Uncharacterized protein n=1 Tax=Araneus ventricosus TaxID=182803 RepID=A0A4Y2NZ43_ARAVE|nr:hypothetical protein AVEN_95096-1 [Araneus ventricosus]
MQYLILLLLVVSASAYYNYGHLYLLPTYEDYYGGYYGHQYGGYNQSRHTSTPSVVKYPVAPALFFNRGEVANSPNVLSYLDPRPADLTAAPSFDVLDAAINTARRRATRAATPEYLYVSRAVSRPTTPADAAVPAFRYIPGHPYGTPVIYGYSSGAYNYYSPSVLSPYSYGSYESYGSYHSDPYGYLYKN